MRGHTLFLLAAVCADRALQSRAESIVNALVRAVFSALSLVWPECAICHVAFWVGITRWVLLRAITEVAAIVALIGNVTYCVLIGLTLLQLDEPIHKITWHLLLPVLCKPLRAFTASPLILALARIKNISNMQCSIIQLYVILCIGAACLHLQLCIAQYYYRFLMGNERH